MYRLVLVTALAAGLPSASTAGMVLPTHAFAGAIVFGPGPIALEGNGRLDTGRLVESRTSGTRRTSGAAHAITDITADRFLKVYAAGAGNEASLFSSGGQGQAVASWRDVAFFDGPGAAPSVLRLTFRADGTLTSGENPGLSFPDNLAEFGVSLSTDPVVFFTEPGAGLQFRANYEYEASSYSGNQEITGNNPGVKGYSARGRWDDFSFSGSSFTGTFHLDIHYRSELGGYGWGITTSARTSSRGGSAEADFLNTVSLESVTLADGTPVAVTFDSGLRFAPTAAVPEPSGLVMLGVGATGLVGYARRRAARRAA